MFRRRRRESEVPEDEPAVGAGADLDAEEVTGSDPVPVADAPAPEDAEVTEPPGREAGPWDESEVTDGYERLDLGSLRLAVPEGSQIQIQVGEDGVIIPTVLVETGALQLAAFAAPRSSGIWDEVREEIAGSLAADGVEVVPAQGPFGPELHAALGVEFPDGTTALQPARFLGSDGPRWFLRGLMTGPAVLDPEAAGLLEAAFAATVVVRGPEAMAVRDLLPLRVPGEVLEAAGVPEEERPAFAPPERGPEITETR